MRSNSGWVKVLRFWHITKQSQWDTSAGSHEYPTKCHAGRLNEMQKFSGQVNVFKVLMVPREISGHKQSHEGLSSGNHDHGPTDKTFQSAALLVWLQLFNADSILTWKPGCRSLFWTWWPRSNLTKQGERSIWITWGWKSHDVIPRSLRKAVS